MNKLYLIIIAGFFGLNIFAQCPNDNFFTLDITPTFSNQNSSWSGATGIWAGDYLTVSVCQGATYTFTMCDNNTIYWDAVMTLYNGGGGAALAYSDDHCGLLPQITWEATFTGTVRIVIDEVGCTSNTGPGMGVYCYMNSNCGTSATPAGVISDQFNNGCNANVGTFIYSNNGTPVTPGSGPMVICNGDASSCFDITSNQDWIQAPAADNNPLEVSEVMHAIYTCPPPANPNPAVDACYSGMLWSGQDITLCGNAGLSGTVGTNNYWLVPITADDSDNGGNPNGVINYDQDGDNCYDVGTPMEIMEVNPINAGTVNENCYNGVISFELNGGQPEVDGSNYVITNNANGTIVSGTITVGGIVVVNGLNNGDTYNFTISDQAGSCPLTISGTYTSCACPTVDFTYTSPLQCDDGQQVFSADQSGMAVGEAITPCYYVQVTPTNAQNGNTIQFYENGTLLGSLTATPNTNYSGYISPVSPSQTNTFDLCETTAGLDMTYYVIDCHSGDVITSGTWVSDGTCQSVTVTPPASNMAGTSSWTGTGVIATFDLGAAIFDPGVAGPGSHNVTYNWDAGNGCSGSATNTIVVQDAVAPTLNCPGNITDFTDPGTCTASVVNPAPSYSDNCNNLTLTWALTGATTGSSPATGMNLVGTQTFNLGVTTVTYTLTDGVNTVTCSYTATVTDNIPPTAVCQDLTINLNASGNATITPAQIDNGSSDNCGIVNYSLDVSSFGCGDLGANTVQLTVTDAAGLSGNCTATVTVADNITPTAICQDLTVNLDALGNATITPAQIDNGSSDNCGIVNYSLDINTFGCGDLGANTVQLTVTDAAGLSDNCTATVTVVDPNVPTASAGSDDAVCEGNAYTLSATSGGSATSGSWSTAGDGTFAPGVSDPNAAYTPGPTDISNGSVTLTWTTDPSPCATASESMILTVNPSPIPVITGDTEYCAGSTASVSTGAFSSYNWSTGATAQNTTVTSANNSVTVTVTDGNGCSGTSAPYDVTENPNPQISVIPNDPTVCNGTDGYITVNSVSGSTSGDVSWTGTSSGSNNTIVLPNDITNLSAGNYNVTFTDVNGCISNTVSTVLTNPGAPIIDLISDTSSCEVDYVVPDPLTYITGTNLTGNQAFYSATGGNAANQITPGTVITSATSPMTIFVYDNSGTCSSEISFVVEVNENPVATISPDPAEVCEGNSLSLNGNPTGGSGTYSTHDWTGNVSILNVTNIQSPSTLTTATSGTYNLTYTVTDDKGCSGSDNITVEINATPVLSGNQEICEDETTTISSTGTPDASTPWTSANTSVATVDASGNVLGISGGTVDITFLDANGCSATISVVVNAKPVITLTPNDPTTCNGTDGFITVNGTGSGTVDWSGDATGTDNSASLPYDISNLAAGNYDVTFTNPVTGCVSDQVSTSLNNPGAPIIDAINDTSSCEVDFVIPDPSTNITGANLTGNQAFYSSPGGNAADELTPGTIITSAMSPMIVYAYDNNGVCQSETSFVVYVNENPTVNISPNPFSVCMDEIIQVNGNPAGGSGNYITHSWTNSGAVNLDDQTIQAPNFSSSTAGNFDLTYTVEDDNGCSATETVAVTVLQSTIIDAMPLLEACGEITLPTITGSNLSGSEAFYDDTQANGGQIVSGNITSSGTYYMYDSGANCSNELMVEITIHEIPQITSVLGDLEYCDYEMPQDIIISVSGQPDWNIEYTVDGVNQTVTSSQNSINLGNSPGIYNITLIEDNFCSDTINEVFELIIKPSPPSPAVYENAEYCSNEEMDTMRAEGSGGTITWYINQFQQVYGSGEYAMPENIIGTTVYYITETINGCESEPSEISINVVECDITLPTAITPDGDGLNDTWEIPNLDTSYPNNVVRVYNRWGGLIFEHDSSKKGPYNNNPWDGTIGGKVLPVGSYYFVIDLNNEAKETKNGAISIIVD